MSVVVDQINPSVRRPLNDTMRAVEKAKLDGMSDVSLVGSALY